jgi:3',5'-cyclic AMP phosphodiesterase CpdA
MKRRNFIKSLGLSSSSLLLPHAKAESAPAISPYSYPEVNKLGDARSKEGEIIVRLEFRSVQESSTTSHEGRIQVKGGKTARIKSYFFEGGEDDFAPENGRFQSHSSHLQADVVVLWLSEASENTRISIDGDEAFSFQLSELLSQPEVSKILGNTKITANLLLDKEIGHIRLEDVGGNSQPGADFSFVIMADPQGGDPEEEGNWPTRMKIHNAWIEDSIRRTNEMAPQPQFTLVLGDIVDSQGQMANFEQMNDFLRRLESPVLYAIGNHETRYRSEFAPGYNMEAFNNYFAAQKALNGMELMLYSFDLGEWHFIVWPDPLRSNFWETHPHYFDWLERDLEKNKARPTFFFQHVPSHPIGINPLINYAESVAVKRTLLDILSRHGNVQYIFSGHVHIPVKASFKTAVSYRGMKMINLPAAGYRPRAFGEEDFAGGPCQGITIVTVKGKEASVRFKTVTQEEFTYPVSLPEFDEDKYALWLSYKWQLPAQKKLVNGSFEQGLKGWTPRFVYTEDENPSNLCEVRPQYDQAGFHALYLHSHKRGYDIPGQDRLPQTINRIAQAISWQPGQTPLLSFRYRVDGKNSDLDGWCGAYAWIEAYDGSFRRMSLVYWSGTAYTGLGTKEDNELGKDIHLKLNDKPDLWHEASLHLASDFNTHSNSSFSALNADRIVVNLGVWTINDGGPYPYSIYFDDLQLEPAPSNAVASRAGGLAVGLKPDEETWWLNKYLPFDHIAGEHRYIFATKKMGPDSRQP